MAVIFKDQQLQIVEPTVVLPGEAPEGYYPVGDAPKHKNISLEGLLELLGEEVETVAKKPSKNAPRRKEDLVDAFMELMAPGEWYPSPTAIKDTAYPYDMMCSKLLETIARKGWDIPGIDVEIGTYGDKDAPLMVANKITGGEAGKKWSITFGRSEFTNGEWNITTLPCEIQIPGQELHMHNDGSGRLYLYVGPDYGKEEERFLNGLKVLSKHHKEPKTYLCYHAEKSGMRHTNDLGREYDVDSAKGERDFIPMTEVYGNILKFLNGVQQQVETLPDYPKEPHMRLRQLARPTMTPAPDNVPLLYVRESDDGYKGAMVQGNGWRLCSDDMENDPRNPFPEKAREGFSYGYTTQQNKRKTFMPGQQMTWGNEKFYEVMLRYANDIYVVDEKAGEICGENEHPRRAIARTMVPLSEYDGSYEQPIYLINRPLGPDEAKDITPERRRAR